MFFAWNFICAIEAINLSWRSEQSSFSKISAVRYDADEHVRGPNPNSDFGESEYPDYAYEFEYF